jgi:hypothetical protein
MWAERFNPQPHLHHSEEVLREMKRERLRIPTDRLRIRHRRLPRLRPPRSRAERNALGAPPARHAITVPDSRALANRRRSTIRQTSAGSDPDAGRETRTFQVRSPVPLGAAGLSWACCMLWPLWSWPVGAVCGIDLTPFWLLWLVTRARPGGLAAWRRPWRAGRRGPRRLGARCTGCRYRTGL